MAAPIGGFLGNTYDVIMCMYAPTHPQPTKPSPYSQWGPPKNLISLKLIEIILFCLKI